jgi:uncharacterized protein (TIGR02996 family)
MPDDDEFLKAITANPDDNVVRREYADWLFAHGDERAHYLRLECQVAEASHDVSRRGELEELLCHWGRSFDRAWLSTVARRRITECALTFRFPCPLRWERLRMTDDPLIRSCDVCQKNVYFCASADEAIAHGKAGQCVALRPLERASSTDDDDGWLLGDIDDDETVEPLHIDAADNSE